jgi:translation initiation factor IF-1
MENEDNLEVEEELTQVFPSMRIYVSLSDKEGEQFRFSTVLGVLWRFRNLRTN